MARKKEKPKRRFIYVVEYKTSYYSGSIEIFEYEGATDARVINKAIKFVMAPNRSRDDEWRISDSYPLTSSGGSKNESDVE
jgi:hypothetical protein